MSYLIACRNGKCALNGRLRLSTAGFHADDITNCELLRTGASGKKQRGDIRKHWERLLRA